MCRCLQRSRSDILRCVVGGTSWTCYQHGPPGLLSRIRACLSFPSRYFSFYLPFLLFFLFPILPLPLSVSLSAMLVVGGEPELSVCFRGGKLSIHRRVFMKFTQDSARTPKFPVPFPIQANPGRILKCRMSTIVQFLDALLCGFLGFSVFMFSWASSSKQVLIFAMPFICELCGNIFC